MFKLFKKQEVSLSQEKKIAESLDFASAEAYNLLRTNVTFSLPGKNCGRVVGVSSPSPAEGKSFTSINLAYSLAKAGQKVLLIDGDLRRPSVARVLSLTNPIGLSNLLIGRDIEQVTNRNVLHGNLDVICSGDVPPNPSELLGSDAMKEWMESFRARYDFVVVDLPPVNSVADPLIISKLLDGIIIVLRHGYTRKKTVREAIRQLRFAEARVLGFVYNGYHRSSGYYKRRGSSYYKHYYASSASNQKKH